jgi:hypothetical protein
VGTSYLQLESGLVIPQQGAGWAAVQAALKQHDSHLELGEVAGVWKVYFRPSPDHPPEFLCDWRDPDGTPRELSHGLVDKVRSLDRNSRERAPTEAELNAKREEDKRKHRERLAQDLAEDSVFKHGRPLLPRSASLRRARSKSGYHDWKV